MIRDCPSNPIRHGIVAQPRIQRQNATFEHKQRIDLDLCDLGAGAGESRKRGKGVRGGSEVEPRPPTMSKQ